MFQPRLRFRMRIVLDPVPRGGNWAAVVMPYIGNSLPGWSSSWPIEGTRPMRYIQWDPKIGVVWADEFTDQPLFDGLDSGPGITHIVLAEWPITADVLPQGIFKAANGGVWARTTHDFDPRGNPVCRCEIVSSSHSAAVRWYEMLCFGEAPVRAGRWSADLSGYERLLQLDPQHGRPDEYPWDIDYDGAEE